MSGSKEPARVVLIDPTGALGQVERALRGEDDTIDVITIERPEGIDDLDAVDCAVVLHQDGAGIDGVTQLRAILERRPELPTVVFAIDPPAFYAEDPLEAGAADVICIGPEDTAEEAFPTLLTRRIRHAAGRGEPFQSAEELLDELLESLPHQIFIKDDEGRIADASSVTAAEYGYSREQLTGLTDHELFLPEVAKELREQEREIMAVEEPLINDVEHYVDAAGRDRWVSITKAPRYDADGNVVGIIGTTSDVTERHRRAEMIDALHSASRRLVEAETRADIAAVVVDIAAEIPDLPRVEVALVDGELSLAAASDQGDELAFERHRTLFETALESGRTRYVIGTDGDARRVDELDGDVQPATVAIPLGDHGVLGVTATGPSLDDDALELAEVLAANVEASLGRAAREEELRERERRLARQNERLEEFASIVSHDLRNPLSVAYGMAEAIEDDGEHVAHLREALERMDRLTEDLLTLAQEGQVVGETEPVSLSDAARRAWTTVPTDGARLAVEADAGTVEADHDRLVEILENLFSNAVEHGSVADLTVTVERIPGGFAVADDGVGIPEASREAVFEQGVSDGGTGFGLDIVRTLAEAHGWHVRADESETGGARIVFETG